MPAELPIEVGDIGHHSWSPAGAFWAAAIRKQFQALASAKYQA
jgi:hypothetical protein